MSIFKNDNKLLKFNGKFFNYVLQPPPPTYKVNLLPSQNGVITADKISGNEGTLVTLSNTPNAHYSFGYYSLTGANLSGNQFYILDQDVSAQGTFVENPKYTLKLQQSSGGTIAANKLTGYSNESATLSYTANQDYYFKNWSTTGATVQNNKVPFTQNTTAKGNFVYTNPLNVSHSTFSKAATTDGLMLRNSYYEIDMQTTGVKSISGFTGMPVIAVNVDIKNNITSLNNMHVIPLFKTEVSAWEMYWDTKTKRWGLDGNTHHRFNAPTIDYHSTYPYWPAMSANRYPMIVPLYAKNIYINPTYGASAATNWIFAKCDNWLNKHNKLQYLIHYKSGSETDKNFDRTCFVSAYHDNNFVCSSWQNLYNVLISNFSAFGGLYSANLAGSGAYHRAVGGSIKLDIARFNTEAAGKKWLEIQ